MRAAIPIGCFGLLVVLAGLLALGSPRPACVVCRAELHSWAVSRPHPGRHLYLEIICPRGYEHLNGRVEYTSAALRWDFRPVRDPRFGPRVARMSRGVDLVPFFGDPIESQRLEAFYILTLEQAECLQRDRMFSREYDLLGPNSTSGLLEVMRDCGCAIPERVTSRGGWTGEFPGAEMSPGPDVPVSLWGRYGVATGPTPIPERASGPATGEPLTREMRLERVLGGQ